MPEVSVILPTMDRWPLLIPRALPRSSPRRTSISRFSSIDDGSSDGTPTRLGAIGDPRLRVLVQETNQGVARARNRGIEEAHGDWVAFLDDDDFWAPTCLREHLRSIADAGAGWGYGAAISVGPDRAAPRDDAGSARGARGRTASAQPRRTAFDGHRPARPPRRGRRLRRAPQRHRRLGPLGATLPACPGRPLRGRRSSPTGSTRRRCITSTAPELNDEIGYLAEKYADLMPTGERFGVRTAARMTVEDDRLAGRRVPAAFAYLRIGASERSAVDLLRGVALLGGERAVSRLKSAARAEVPEPEWLTAAIGEPADARRGDGRAGSRLARSGVRRGRRGRAARRSRSSSRPATAGRFWRRR